MKEDPWKEHRRQAWILILASLLTSREILNKLFNFPILQVPEQQRVIVLPSVGSPEN